jgi:hypothetical protein
MDKNLVDLPGPRQPFDCMLPVPLILSRTARHGLLFADRHHLPVLRFCSKEPKMVGGMALVWDAFWDSFSGFGGFEFGRVAAFFDTSVTLAEWGGGYREGGLAARAHGFDCL